MASSFHKAISGLPKKVLSRYQPFGPWSQAQKVVLGLFLNDEKTPCKKISTLNAELIDKNYGPGQILYRFYAKDIQVSKGDRIYFKQKGDVNNRNTYLEKILLFAANQSNIKIIKLLLHHGIDVSAISNNIAILIYNKACKGRIQFIKAFIDARTDINAKNKNVKNRASFGSE